MARSFSYVSNPFTGYRGGYAYRGEDPSFNVKPSGASKAAGLSTLPNVYKSIRKKSPDYSGLAASIYDDQARTEANLTASAGGLIANDLQLQQLEGLQGLSGGGGSSSSGMLSSGLGLLGGVAGSFIPGLGPAGSMAGSFLGKTVGNALEGIF